MDSPAPQTTVPAAVGATLRAAREAQGLSIEDITRQLKLSAAQINAIEADDHAKLPGPVFARGFIRSYARLLKLDSAKLLEPRLPASPAPAVVVVDVLPPLREVPSPGMPNLTEGAVLQPVREPKAPAPMLTIVVDPARVVSADIRRDMPRESLAETSRAIAREFPRAAPQEIVRETIVESRLRSGPHDALEPSQYRRVPALLGSVAIVVLGLAYYEFVYNAPAPPAEIPAAAAAASVPASPVVRTDAIVAPSSHLKGAADPAPPAPEAIAQPVGAALALKKSAEPAAGVPRGLHFVFNGESWVEVRDGDGNIVFSRTNEAGSERRVQGTPPLSIVVGGSSRVQLSYNGQAIDLLAYTREDVARLRLE